MKVNGITPGVQTYYEPIKRADENINADNGKAVADTGEKAPENAKVEAKKISSEVYGDVLSKSTDGDVTTAAKQSLNALSDGLVLQKDNASEVTTSLREPFPKETPTDDAKKDEDINSLTGYTSNQLENLYNQGKISKYDYDREVARREELTEEKEPVIAEEEKENPAIISDEDEDEAKDLQKQIANNNAFNTEMAELNNTAINDELKVDALNTAKENDRMDLINQIMGQN